jgi:hypothetical protein
MCVFFLIGGSMNKLLWQTPHLPLKTLARFLLAVASLGVMPFSMANPPHLPDLIGAGNRWSITFFDDSSAAHTQWATQGICFYNAGVAGTHQRYYWVSDTYPDWNGRATQEGDQIFMHGDFRWPFTVINGGHDGMTWEIVSLKEGAGHWKEWVEDAAYGTTIGFGNAKLVRVGSCIQAGFETVDSALKTGLQLQLPRAADGRQLLNPMGVFDVLQK